MMKAFKYDDELDSYQLLIFSGNLIFFNKQNRNMIPQQQGCLWDRITWVLGRTHRGSWKHADLEKGQSCMHFLYKLKN